MMPAHGRHKDTDGAVHGMRSGYRRRNSENPSNRLALMISLKLGDIRLFI